MSFDKNLNISFNIIKVVLLLTIIIFAFKIFIIGFSQHEEFSRVAEYQKTIETKVFLPRGKIFDSNGTILVDNVNHKSLNYIESSIMDNEEKFEVAQKVSNIIEVKDASINEIELIDLWLKQGKNLKTVQSSFTIEEKESLKNKSDKELNDFIRSKVDRNLVNAFVEQYGNEVIYIRIKMSQASSKNPSQIENSLSVEEAYQLESKSAEIGGFYVTESWQRTYPQGETMRSMLGNYGKIPEEDSDLYKSKGYGAGEMVGTSYLEKELEAILRSYPQTIGFYFDKDGNIINQNTKNEGRVGDDVILTIDLNLQKIAEEEVTAFLKRNPYYYNDRSFVTIQNPSNGDILAMAGMVESKGEYLEHSIGNFTEAYAIGSIAKPAVLLTSYDLGVRQWGDVILDAPMLIKDTPKKASYTNMGPVSEMDAIARSSNVYFYKTFLDIAGASYAEGESLNIEEKYFELVRKYFEQFGLGTSTGIDFSTEETGFRGSQFNPGLYMDLANGQYDTYTNLQSSQYINTIASIGKRYKPQYIKSINRPDYSGAVGKVEEEERATLLNELTMTPTDINHVIDAMTNCFNSSSGLCSKGFSNPEKNFSGKTGTSETFAWDVDQKMLVKTNSSTFMGIFPYKDGRISVSTIVPNIKPDGPEIVEDATELTAKIINRYLGR